jgi:hypothetical protein
VAEKFIPSDSDSELEKEASMSRGIGDLWRLIHENSYGPLAMIGGLFAFVCWPTSLIHVFALIVALALLSLLRTVARHEGYQLGKKAIQKVAKPSPLV